MSFQNKMSPAQKKLMEAYMEQYPLVGKITNRTRQERIRQNFLWDKLVSKLNSLGPPARNKSEWRRTWACLKYKAKVKTPSKDNYDDNYDAYNEDPPSELSNDRLVCPKSENDLDRLLNKEPNEEPCHADTSIDTRVTTNSSRIRMQRYFDCFNESVLALPEHLQLKCRNEIFAVITKYEEMANLPN